MMAARPTKKNPLELGARTLRVERRDPAQDTASRHAIESGRNRLVVAIALFSVCFISLAGRLVDLSLLRQAEEPSVSHAGATTAVTRADIVDRSGQLLATTLETGSLYADTREIQDPELVAAGIINVLGDLDYDDVLRQLKSGRSFYWIKRNLTPRQQQQITELGVPALHFVSEDRRVYPQGPLLAHVLGFVDSDNKGIAGIERRFNGVLTDPARHGRPLALSIDLRVQHTLRDELQRGIAEFSAVGGMGIVMDARTGEVIAMASLPDFDPNEPGASAPENLFNRATLGAYEPGSTFKTFNTAMALDSGTAKVFDRFDATHPIQIGRFSIKDHEPKNRWLTVAEVIAYSSNVGSARIAQAAGVNRQQDYLNRFGLLDKSPIELPEVGEPQYPANWREINLMTIAFGHGIAVTPIQIASGIATTVNGGLLMPATVIKRDPIQQIAGTRAIAPETSATMRQLLRLIVTDGTGRKADLVGYQVGGKTGTAEKVGGAGGYRRKANLTSFASVFPMSDPRYVVLCMLDEPKATKKTFGWATAGWNAVPVARRVIERIAPMLNVPPSDTPDEHDPALLVAFKQ
jgi:cell division protein FtsI (penicillin-binding protein 3)